MSLQHATTLAELLDRRDIKAKSLAAAIGTDPSTVSRWRGGLKPSQEMRGRIIERLDLTESEVVALGWDKEKVDA